MSRWIAIGGFSGCLSVGAGAFGAHFLKERLDAELLAAFDIGARYQLLHSVCLVLVGSLESSSESPPRALGLSAWAFLLGTIVFSGSLYVLALSGVRAWGAVTPIGGVALIAGWFLLGWAGLRRGRESGRSAGPRQPVE